MIVNLPYDGGNLDKFPPSIVSKNTMKLYTYPAAPSPRRIHLFLAEKALEIEQVVVDLRKGEHLKPEFAAINPALTVPALLLDDGTSLCESVAICDYLESIKPEPVLIGASGLKRALVIERNHWVESSGLTAVMEGFRNRSGAMLDHALTGPRSVPQIPELADRGVRRFGWFLADLDGLLRNSEFLAGPDFSMADITALVTIEFAAWGLKKDLPANLPALQRWHATVTNRPAIQSAGSG